MSTISKNIQQGALKTNYRSANSWNISSSSFDGPNTYSYSRSVFDDGYDTIINRSGNAVYSIGGGRTLGKKTPPTSWDISNLTPSGGYAFFNPYTDTGTSVVFSNDGNSVIIGGTSNAYIQYNLASPWDISNSSMVSGTSYVKSFVNKYFITEDGTRMYTIEDTRVLKQYSLSTPFDLKTATLVGSYTMPFTGTFSVSSAQDLYVRPDGTEVFILDSNGSSSRVSRFTLTTPWNITTASYLIYFLTIGSQESTPIAFTFKPDGTGMYVWGNGRRIYYYKFFVAWDRTSAVSQGAVLNFSNGLGPNNFITTSFALSADGYNAYIISWSKQVVRKYVANTAWDYTTVPLDAYYYPMHAQEYSLMNRLAHQSTRIWTPKPDGTKMFFSNGNLNVMGDMTSPNDLTTLNIPHTDGGISFKSAGIGHTYITYDYSKLYTTARNNRLYEYTMNGSFSVAGISNTSTNVYIANNFTSFTMSNNNMDVYLCYNYFDTTVYRYKMSNAANLSSITYVNALSVAGTSYGVDSLSLKNDNTRLYVNAKNKLIMFDYALTANPSNTSISITTSYPGQKLLTNTSLDYPIGLYFKPDGTKLYIGDYKDGTLLTYNLSTPWDIQTATYSSATVIYYSASDTIGRLYITRDGTTIYHMAYTNSFDWYRVTKTVYSNPWIFSGGTQVFSTILTDFPFRNILFSNDGTKAYASNATSIVEYSLSTPWDITTKALTYTLIGDFSDNLVISPSGNAIYTSYLYQIKKIPLSTNWSLATNQTPIVYTQSQSNNVVGLAFDTGGNNIFTLGFDRSNLFSYSIG